MEVLLKRSQCPDLDIIHTYHIRMRMKKAKRTIDILDVFCLFEDDLHVIAS